MSKEYKFQLRNADIDYDDINRFLMTHIEDNENIGIIDFEVLYYDSGYFDHVYSEEEFYELFDTDKVIYIQTVKIFRDYRYNGYGRIMMKKFIDKYAKKFGDTLVLYADTIDNDLGIEDYEYRDTIIIKFYESLGFIRDMNTNYMYLKI